MAQLILIRHGQTVWNAERRLQGHLDSSLSAKGENEAEAVARRLRDEPLTALYSSDLGRAMTTARAINEAHRLPMHTDARLREVNLGRWEGKAVTDLEADEAESNLLALWRADSVANRPPGGERLEELQARVIQSLQEIAAANPGGRVAVVTHGGVVKAAVAWILGIPLERQRRFDVNNASLTRLDLSPKREAVICLNDFSHCPSEAQDDSIGRGNA